MQLSKRIFFIAAMLPLIVGLSGCASSMIPVRDGSDRVSLADADQVGSCKSLGKTTVSVLAKVGIFMTRSAEDVEANLLQLARNDAVDDGADTLVKGDSQEFGKRTFSIYKCRP
jgi:Domain of unknown function (DUF4156)